MKPLVRARALVRRADENRGAGPRPFCLPALKNIAVERRQRNPISIFLQQKTLVYEVHRRKFDGTNEP